jgi:hypothetical protein
MRLVDKIFLGILLSLYLLGSIILIGGTLYYGF